MANHWQVMNLELPQQVRGMGERIIGYHRHQLCCHYVFYNHEATPLLYVGYCTSNNLLLAKHNHSTKQKRSFTKQYRSESTPQLTARYKKEHKIKQRSQAKKKT